MISNKQIEANRAHAETDEAVRHSDSEHASAPYPPDADQAGNTPGQGPAEEGKKRSRLNALRHGLTGQVTTMTDEDRAAHGKFSSTLIQDLAPDGAVVTFDEKVRPYPRDVLATGDTCGRQLAQRIATDSWRLNRISAVEDNLFALGLHEHGGQLCPGNDQIDAALTTARVFAGTVRHAASAPYPRNGLAQPNTLGQTLQLLTLCEQRLNRAIQKNLAMLQSLQATRKVQREVEMKEAATLLKLTEMRGLEYTPANARQDGFVFSTAEIHAAIDREQRLQRASTTDLSKYKPRKFHSAAA